MIRTGIVAELSGNTAKVLLDTHSSCSNCGMCMGSQQKRLLVEVKAPSWINEGDTVEVSLAPDATLKAAFLAYLFPLFLLLAGIFVGAAVFRHSSNKDIISAGMGIFLAFMGFVFIRYFDRFFTQGDKFSLNITAVIRGGTRYC